MLGFFPVPYPDELMYSVLARLNQRLGHPSAKQFTRAVFGDAHKSSGSIYLPTRLNALIRQLPPDHGLTIDLIFTNHKRHS